MIVTAVLLVYISIIFFFTVFDPSIEDSDEYKKVHKEYKAVVSHYSNIHTKNQPVKQKCVSKQYLNNKMLSLLTRMGYEGDIAA